MLVPSTAMISATATVREAFRGNVTIPAQDPLTS